MNCAMDLQDALIAAECSQGISRATALRRADVHLGRLRTYLRLVHQWAWLSDGQYEHVCKMIAEIGKLLGGWIKVSGNATA